MGSGLVPQIVQTTVLMIQPWTIWVTIWVMATTLPNSSGYARRMAVTDSFFGDVRRKHRSESREMRIARMVLPPLFIGLWYHYTQGEAQECCEARCPGSKGCIGHRGDDRGGAQKAPLTLPCC